MNSSFPGERVPFSNAETNDQSLPAEAGGVGPGEELEQAPAERDSWERFEGALAGPGAGEKVRLWARMGGPFNHEDMNRTKGGGGR